MQMLDTLLNTLIREQQNNSIAGRAERAREVTRRFVRSVARIFVIFSVEMAPGAAKKKGYMYLNFLFLSCEVFTHFSKFLKKICQFQAPLHNVIVGALSSCIRGPRSARSGGTGGSCRRVAGTSTSWSGAPNCTFPTCYHLRRLG